MCPQSPPQAVVVNFIPTAGQLPRVSVSVVQDRHVVRVSEMRSDDWLELSEVVQLSLTCVLQDVVKEHHAASTS